MNDIKKKLKPDINIQIATRTGNIEAVKQHIAAGTDVNAEGGFNERKPLHLAAYEGHKQIAELLISKGADVNAKDKSGWTPLALATIYSVGHKEIVELLIAEGADVNVKGDRDATPLHGAASRGHKQIAELLIAKGADVNAKAFGDATPLFYAISGGQKEIAELLIAKGADVNAKRVDYGTPLEQARRGRIETGTPLDVAESMKNRNVIAALLRKHGGKTGEELKELEAAKESIHAAAELGNIKAVKHHLAAGTDVDTKIKDESTPLHKATYKGHKKIVELLIAKGADVNAIDNGNGTALDYALFHNHVEIASILRKHGSKASLISDKLILELATKGDYETLKQKLAAGANANAKNDDGETLLHYAARACEKEIADLLINNGAIVNAKNNKGKHL